MRYELDLTEADLPKWWPDWAPNIIPMVTGRNAAEFDLDMPEEWTHRFIDFAKENGLSNADKADKSLPIGMSVSRMPVGAKIKKISGIL